MQKTTCLEIDGRPFVLGEGRDLTEVMTEIEVAAARPAPTFVQLASGDEFVSVLISSTTRVVVMVCSNSDDHEAVYGSTTSHIADWDL